MTHHFHGMFLLWCFGPNRCSISRGNYRRRRWDTSECKLFAGDSGISVHYFRQILAAIAAHLRKRVVFVSRFPSE